MHNMNWNTYWHVYVNGIHMTSQPICMYGWGVGEEGKNGANEGTVVKSNDLLLSFNQNMMSTSK